MASMSRGDGQAREGLAFANEAALQDALEDGLARLDLASNRALPHALARREVPIGGCIPDLVLVRFAEIPSPALWPARRSFRHAFVISLLRQRGPLRIQTIASKAFESADRIQPVVDDLLMTGALSRASTGTVSLSHPLAFMEAQVIAVEAKLRRWKDALKQAAQYTSFANRSVVAMDVGGVPRSADALDQFRRSGIGLCAIGPEGAEWLVVPRSTQRRGPEWEYLVSSAASPRRHTLWSLR